MISKFLLTKPLIKLYYLIFKLRKSGITESPWHKLIGGKALHVLVFCLTLSLISFNILNINKNYSNTANQANKTIISHLAKNEFSVISDDADLIEETSNLKQLLASANEKYSSLADAILNRPWISDISDEESDLVYNGEALINDTPIDPDQDVTSTNTNNPTVIAKRSEIIFYTVNNGDTISSIANKFQISINTILWSNNLTAFSLIRPGDKLMIMPVSGTSYTVKSGDTVGRIALKFGIEEASIFQYNNIKSAGGLVIGKTIIIPGGKKINDAIKIVKATTNSNKVNNAVSVIEKLVNPKKAPESSTRLLWPTEGHRITEY